MSLHSAWIERLRTVDGTSEKGCLPLATDSHSGGRDEGLVRGGSLAELPQTRLAPFDEQQKEAFALQMLSKDRREEDHGKMLRENASEQGKPHENVKGFGPFTMTSSKPPRPNRRHLRASSRGAFDPYVSAALQSEVLKSKERSSTLPVTIRWDPAVSENRSADLVQQHDFGGMETCKNDTLTVFKSSSGDRTLGVHSSSPRKRDMGKTGEAGMAVLNLNSVANQLASGIAAESCYHTIPLHSTWVQRFRPADWTQSKSASRANLPITSSMPGDWTQSSPSSRVNLPLAFNIKDSVHRLKAIWRTESAVSMGSTVVTHGCTSAISASHNEKGMVSHVPSGTVPCLHFASSVQLQTEDNGEKLICANSNWFRLATRGSQERISTCDSELPINGDRQAKALFGIMGTDIPYSDSKGAVNQASFAVTKRPCAAKSPSSKDVIDCEKDPLALSSGVDSAFCRSSKKRKQSKDEWINISHSWLKRWCTHVIKVNPSGKQVDTSRDGYSNLQPNITAIGNNKKALYEAASQSRGKMLETGSKFDENLNTTKPFAKVPYFCYGFNIVSHSTSHPTTYFSPSVRAMALVGRVMKHTYASSKQRRNCA